MSASTAPIHPDIERVLLEEARLQARIKELAAQISRDYKGRSPVLVGILKGSVFFLGDLMRHLAIDCTLDFICMSSYSGTKSTGVVRMLLDLRDSPQGKDLIVVEDIMDTGLTLNYLLENLRTRGPKSVEVCALLDKPTCRKVAVKAKYVGFSIPNEFVVGFGLDFDEKYRNLPYVGVLRNSGK